MNPVKWAVLLSWVALWAVVSPGFDPAARCRAARTPATAAVDSAQVAAYLQLPGKEVKERRERAERWIEQAGDELDGPARLALLREAADADPAGTANWLALSDLQFEMGCDAEAEASLAAARVTIKFLKGKERRQAIGDYSVAMGWAHYRDGRWREGKDWGERALRFDAGLPGHLVVLLNEARYQTSSKEMYLAAEVFKPTSIGNRRYNMSWCQMMQIHFHMEGMAKPDAAAFLDWRTYEFDHDVLRWRDYGLFNETRDTGDLAVAYYEKSAAAIRAPRGGWLTRVDRVNPALSAPDRSMPVWINRDGGYVTGSLVAYLGHCRDRMAAAGEPAERDAWAERVLSGAGRATRRHLENPWPTLWSVEAMLELDRVDDAASEIRYAMDKFRVEGIEEPAVGRVHGRIHLVRKKFGRALQLLRPAVEAFPDDASCWADLGIAEAMAGDRTEARAAFDRALALDPGLAAAWYNRGLLCMKEGDLQSAQADLERAVELVPENEEIRSDLARLAQKAKTQRLAK